MLNPIENIWSKIKTYAKTHLRVPQVRGIGVVEPRLLYLEQIIDFAKDASVPEQLNILLFFMPPL
jgi:hypothetical protein